MKKLWYFVYFLGILSWISYFPILFFLAKGQVSHAKYLSYFGGFFIYFLMIFPIILGFVLMIIANLKLHKIRILEINKVLENSVRIESLNQKEISQLDYRKNQENSQKSEQIRGEIIQILTRKNPLIQNLIFVSYQISDKLRTFNFLKKLHIENCSRKTLYINDYLAFWYK